MMLADCVSPRIENPLPALRTPEACHASECTTGTYHDPSVRASCYGSSSTAARRGPLFVRPLEEVHASVERDRAVSVADHDPRPSPVLGERVAVLSHEHMFAYVRKGHARCLSLSSGLTRKSDLTIACFDR